jgi:O-antigen ligase
MIIYYILIWSLPYIQHPIWNATLGGGFTVTKLIGAASILYGLTYLARRHDLPRYFATPQSRWMMLLVGFAFYSFLSNQHAAINLGSPMAAYASAILLFFVTLTVIDSVRRLYWSMMVAVGAVAFASLYFLREWRRGIAVYGTGFRAGWVLGDANYFTIAALATLPIAFELLLMSRKRWEKLYLFGCMFLTFFTITLGASRGGFFGMVTEIIYLIVRSGISKKNLVRIMVTAIPLVILLPNSPVHRLISPTPNDNSSVESHVVGWMAGLNMLTVHPFFGIGLANYKAEVAKYDKTGLAAANPHIAHNAYLEIAAEMGIPAGLVYLIFLGTTLRSLETTRKRALAAHSKVLASIALGMGASLLGPSVAIFFVSGQYTRMFWFILVVSMSMPALVPKRRAAQTKTPAQEQPIEDSDLQIGTALIEMR